MQNSFHYGFKWSIGTNKILERPWKHWIENPGFAKKSINGGFCVCSRHNSSEIPDCKSPDPYFEDDHYKSNLQKMISWLLSSCLSLEQPIYAWPQKLSFVLYTISRQILQSYTVTLTLCSASFSEKLSPILLTQYPLARNFETRLLNLDIWVF